MNVLSETLRLELAPLNVRVITVMAGSVISNIAANGPPPASLPSTSVYLPVEKYLAVELELDGMDTHKFAEQIVGSVVKGVTGKVWAGKSVGIIRMLQVAPQWVFVSLPSLDLFRIRLLRLSRGYHADLWCRIRSCSLLEGGLIRCRTWGRKISEPLLHSCNCGEICCLVY